MLICDLELAASTMELVKLSDGRQTDNEVARGAAELVMSKFGVSHHTSASRNYINGARPTALAAPPWPGARTGALVSDRRQDT